jgi:hypothetical protein
MTARASHVMRTRRMARHLRFSTGLRVRPTFYQRGRIAEEAIERVRASYTGERIIDSVEKLD